MEPKYKHGSQKLSVTDYPGFESKPEEDRKRILAAINKRKRRMKLRLNTDKD